MGGLAYLLLEPSVPPAGAAAAGSGAAFPPLETCDSK